MQWQRISTKSGSMLVKDSAVIEYKVTKSHVTVPHHLGSVLAITVGIREPTILRLEIARFWTNDGRPSAHTSVRKPNVELSGS